MTFPVVVTQLPVYILNEIIYEGTIQSIYCNSDLRKLATKSSEKDAVLFFYHIPANHAFLDVLLSQLKERQMRGFTFFFIFFFKKSNFLEWPQTINTKQCPFRNHPGVALH